MSIIDPLEAVLNLARLQSALMEVCTEQIAGQHHFGKGPGDWDAPSNALTLQLDGGEPDLYVPTQPVRIEARCYGPSWSAAFNVYGELITWLRAFERSGVVTSQGKALVYSITLASQPSRIIDPDVDVPALLVFLNTRVHEQGTT